MSLPSSLRLWAALVISLLPPWNCPWSLLLRYKIRMILRSRSQATWTKRKRGRKQDGEVHESPLSKMSTDNTLISWSMFKWNSKAQRKAIFVAILIGLFEVTAISLKNKLRISLWTHHQINLTFTYMQASLEPTHCCGKCRMWLAIILLDKQGHPCCLDGDIYCSKSCMNTWSYPCHGYHHTLMPSCW